MTIAEAKANAEAWIIFLRELEEGARREYSEHMENYKNSEDVYDKKVAMTLADLASCRARRSKQWIDSYLVLLEDINERE